MAERITLARPYAKAAFEVALAQKHLKAWEDFLAIAAVVAKNEQVAKVLKSPNFSTEEQVSLFIDVCKTVIFEESKTFLKVLEENKRLELLPEIAELFGEYRASYEKEVDVEMISAMPLSKEHQENFAKSLEARLKHRVVLSCREDKTLLGGAIIRAGDLVFDGSVRGKLRYLGQELLS